MIIKKLLLINFHFYKLIIDKTSYSVDYYEVLKVFISSSVTALCRVDIVNGV